MTRQLILGCIIAVIILSSRAKANESADGTSVLEFFRTEEFLQDVMPCMERHLNEFARSNKKMSASQKELISGMIKRIYPDKNLYKIFKESFAEAITSEDIVRAKTFMKTPTGIKLRQSYRAAFAAGSTARKRYYDNFSNTLLTPNRKNSILTFITSLEQDRLQSAMESRCTYGIELAFNSLTNANEKKAAKILKEKAENSELSFMDAARAQYELFDFFMLKDIPQQEIDAYSIYYSSAAGKPIIRAYRKALTVTMEAAANTLATQLAGPAAVPAKRKK